MPPFAVPTLAGSLGAESAGGETSLKSLAVSFAFFGTDLRFRRINRSLARLHGRNGSDHLGLLPTQVWPESLAARAEAAIHHVLADDQPLFEPDQCIGGPSAGDGRAADRPSGTSSSGTSGADTVAARQARHWAFSWFPSHDPEGEISGVALIAVDVTERRNAEEAVRRSEERYRSLVQAGAQVV